ncbi:SusD/RagB family nutrient-binding outer membrane lipoprotein [Parapedobacter koreensis]|nr:SusD/RagB family nutrient-binding outer membrane lipoprotein [Parapedobacter koreensis]
MKRLYILLVLSGLFGACKKFDSFGTDPNKTTQASPDLLLNTISQHVFNQVDLNVALASRQMVYTDGVSNVQYYGWQRGGFDEYNDLRLVYRMEQEANRVGRPEYVALAKFFKSWLTYELTLRFGDVPYTDAAKGDEQLYTPAYDQQADIFAGILAALEEANAMLGTESLPVLNDIIYDGDIMKWKKLINTFSLRVLMSLSRKEGSMTLNIKQKFAQIINNPGQYPIFESNADNASLRYYDLVGNRYPYFNNNDIQTAEYMEESFVNLLKELRDPRLFRYAAKTPNAAALADDDFNAYAGVLGSGILSANREKVIAGDVSKINARYYNSATNEPCKTVSYAELQLLIAEAILRGWVGGNASDYYINGIAAAVEEIQVPAEQAAAYVASIAQTGLVAGREIEQIIMQKYIASFMNNGWHPFYEQRRTGFPVFNVAGGGVVNNGRIPKRWMYPDGELTNNSEHIMEAITRQFPQGDDINAEMWLLTIE